VVNFDQTPLTAIRYEKRRRRVGWGRAMLTSAECRAQAEQKLAEANRDYRHRKRLITAAEAWLFLANQLKRAERIVVAQGRPKRAKRAATGH
jgi:hypothetical protein